MLFPSSFAFSQINDKFRIKLCDFGISKLVPEGDIAHSLVGSPLWMAPEVLSRNYTNKVDVFSFAIILVVTSLSNHTFFPFSVH
jgi:calcium-dependent protein kinase